VRSNLISSGKSPQKHFMFSNSCTTLTAANNYLWIAAAGGVIPGDAFNNICGTGTGGVTDPEGDILGDHVSCYDASFAQPSFIIDPSGPGGSPCS